MRKLILSFLVLFGMVTSAIAQSRIVTGKVTDTKGKPVPNASVVVKGTNVGVTATSTGEFKITVPADGSALIINSVGLEQEEITLTRESNYTVSLNAKESVLQEVVLVGYSSTTKEAFTGSAKVVTGEQLNNKSVSNVSQALAGEVAGVRVVNTSGQPGTAATIRIRGIGSVNGNRSPLYVVDGVPFSGNISAINPADIATLTVLKDAAATSIYGSRGANGVIVVTTRSGKSKASFIEVEGKFGTNSQILPRYDVIRSPEQFIALAWEGLYNQGTSSTSAANRAAPGAYANARLFSSAGISVNNNIWKVANGGQLIDSTTRSVRPGVVRKYDPENWEKYAFQPSNRVEGSIRMGGGDSKTNYFTSFGYLNDKGYSIKSDYERITARLNLNHEVKSWLSTSFNVGYANSTTNSNGQEENSNSVFWFADNIPSIYPLFLRDTTGNFVADPIFGGNQFDYGANGRKFGSLTNAIADATYNTYQAKNNELTGNTSVTLKFTKDLSFVTRLGAQYYNEAYVNLTNKFYGSAASQNGSIFQRKIEQLNTNFLTMLRYNKRFGTQNIEVLAAHEATDYKRSRATASAYSLVENNSFELNNAVVSNPVKSYSLTNKLESYFAQLNYDYAGTYYLSGTVRRDGSSRFISNNKWGTFGSVGAGVVLSKMKFMQNVNFISFLKLKASYGLLGDQEGLGYYPGYDRYDIGNLNNAPSFAFATKGNPDLTWETSKMFQTGIEFGLGKWLTGSVEYYNKNTDDLIFDRRVGPSIGYAIIQVNGGQLQNRGLEFDLTAHIVKKQDYFLDFGVNGESFTNKIISMPIDPATGKQKVIDVQAPYGYSVDHSIYDFYIRNFAGVDPQTGTSTWTVFYDDINNDGVYNKGEQVANLEQYYGENPGKKGTLKEGITKTYSEATQYYIGKSGLPKVRGGINLNAGIKGFQLSVQMLYSFGGYAYDFAYASLMNNGLVGGNNWHTDILNRWQKAGDITDVPRISNQVDANVNSSSSRFITKANYVSLNNVRLGYSMPSSLLKKLGNMQELSFYVSGDNLWLHSQRDGFNPSTAENGSSNQYRYSPLSTLTVGLKTRF